MNHKPAIVLAGNPNVGKTTIFNCLTGMRQHTGNWAGKTVASACGVWRYGKGKRKTLLSLIDSPGCYSLNTSSPEEELAKEQICDPAAKGVIIVCDGTCLERNLILALQILAVRKDVVLCVNLMDQVRKKKITIDGDKLESLLGIKSYLQKQIRKGRSETPWRKLPNGCWTGTPQAPARTGKTHGLI